jgi:hypothetical protein
MTPTTLVQSQAATKFIQNMSLPTFRKVELGDPLKFANVNAPVSTAHDAIKSGVEILARLAQDKTRSEPERHEAARTVATRVAAVLQQSQAAIAGTAQRLGEQAMAMVEERFAPKEGRGAIESDIRTWIRETVKLPDGMAQIRQAVTTNSEIAAVVFHSPFQLLGVSEDARRELIRKASITFLPKASALAEEAAELAEMAERYPQVIRSVHASFYNNAVAEQAKTRVEI